MTEKGQEQWREGADACVDERVLLSLRRHTPLSLIDHAVNG